MQVCTIPERTAYRYLNRLSEANVPVYFDRKIHAYRLNQNNLRNIGTFSLDEDLFIIIGLKMLSKSLNEDYQNKFDKLITKLISSQKFPLEDILLTYDNYINDINISSDNSNFISSILINSAISFNKKVKITTNQSEEDTVVEIENPSIYFDGDWKISDHDNFENTKILSDIKIVSIS